MIMIMNIRTLEPLLSLCRSSLTRRLSGHQHRPASNLGLPILLVEARGSWLVACSLLSYSNARTFDFTHGCISFLLLLFFSFVWLIALNKCPQNLETPPPPPLPKQTKKKKEEAIKRYKQKPIPTRTQDSKERKLQLALAWSVSRLYLSASLGWKKNKVGTHARAHEHGQQMSGFASITHTISEMVGEQ